MFVTCYNDLLHVLLLLLYKFCSFEFYLSKNLEKFLSLMRGHLDIGWRYKPSTLWSHCVDQYTVDQLYSKKVICAVHSSTTVPPNSHAAGLSPCLNFFQMAFYTVVSSELDFFF